MINIRSGIFETNSSSNHNLTIIKDEIYRRWKNHEIVLKIDYEYDTVLDIGDGGLFRTWGNFFLEQGKYTVADIGDQREKNLEILKIYLDIPDVSQKLKDSILKYEKTGELSSNLFIENLYLTPEEYIESLEHDDCQSPFLYKGEDVVVIGHYYRS